MNTLKPGAAAALAIAACVIWLALIRRGPEETALATILTKGHLSGSTYFQQPIGADRGFKVPTHIAIAEANAFELTVDGVADTVRASFNTVKSRQFDVGQRVRVQYERRGIPPLWTRITVVEMTPADTP